MLYGSTWVECLEKVKQRQRVSSSLGRRGMRGESRLAGNWYDVSLVMMVMKLDCVDIAEVWIP